jgi:methyl-accepting chemotaxis protein
MNFTKRKNYFIEREFQTKYLLLTIIMLLAYTLLFVTIIFAPYILKLYLNYPLAEKAEAAKVLLFLHGTVWPWIGGVILFFGAFSIFISHKIAGPLFRIKKTLAQMTEGDLNTSVRLRKWDDLKDLAQHVNHLIEELRNFLTTLRNDYDLLSEYILELERQVDSKVISEESGREIIKKVQASRKNIEAVLEKFKLQR